MGEAGKIHKLHGKKKKPSKNKGNNSTKLKKLPQEN